MSRNVHFQYRTFLSELFSIGGKMKECISMDTKERERLKVLSRLAEGGLSRRIAAQQLQVSERQLRRLVRIYEKEGDKGLISKHRGKQSNNQVEEQTKKNALELIRVNYSDFGPTLAHEKLKELHRIKISKSTIRLLMIENKIWQPRRGKVKKVHKCRQRRECFGELIQMDGSYHDWFEGRAPQCCLLVLIDDATSQLVLLKFVEWESVFNYFECIKEHLKVFGCPLAIYTDRHAIFETTRKTEKDYKDTQFHRAMNELGIELILALSPQAKGRVERVNGTLQDRLVKEMRLAGISSIEEANVFVEDFIKTHNQKFAKKPASPINAHKLIENEAHLDRILCLHHERKITRDLMVSWAGQSYQITEPNSKNRLGGRIVVVLEDKNKNIKLFYHGKYLSFINFKEIVVNEKIIRINNFRKQRGGHPSPQHPWKQWVPHSDNREKKAYLS